MAKLVYQQAEVLFNMEAKTVHWHPGLVRVEALSRTGLRVFTARRAVVTLPLGVLKCNGLAFEPALPGKQTAMEGLAMGYALKVSLHFQERFWPAENSGFIHSDHEWLPTWWSDEGGRVLTGWAGGPRAEWLSEEDEGSVLSEAFSALGRIFSVGQDQVADLLMNSFTHNWSEDPYSRGAYSFTPVGMMDMSGRLAEPVAETLFFAGEATCRPGEQGTVHGAFSSGYRAASQVLRTLQAERRDRGRARLS
jgi:monoamine oxidase